MFTGIKTTCITSGVYVPDICDEYNMSCLFDVTIPFAVCETLIKGYVSLDKTFGNSSLPFGINKAREQGLELWLSHMLQIWSGRFFSIRMFRIAPLLETIT